MRDFDEQMRERGIDPKSGRAWGCWEGGRPGGLWVRGVPSKPRPWEAKA